MKEIVNPFTCKRFLTRKPKRSSRRTAIHGGRICAGCVKDWEKEKQAYEKEVGGG
jgi:hypothetical protein